MAHSLCSGVRSDMQRAWIIDLNSLLVSLLKVDKSVRLVKLVSVHFFHIWTSESGPNPSCFVHVALEMCFAPQRRAIVHLSSGQLAPHLPL